MSRTDHPLEQFLRTGEPLHVAADGQMHLASPEAQALLPGSFNPIHRGHWELARIAAEMLGIPVAFELSVENVDKVPLTPAEIRCRLAQFDGQAPVWLTRAARFIDKAAHFPGTTFVVGADTAVRIVAPRFYESEAAMRAALDQIGLRGCRFLVACRVDERGQFLRVGNVAIPLPYQSLFMEILPERFRWDISSTVLRALEDPI